jgi:hypothetical protein
VIVLAGTSKSMLRLYDIQAITMAFWGILGLLVTPSFYIK